MKTFVTIDDQAFEQIIVKLEALEKQVQAHNNPKQIGWLNNQQFCEALSISTRCAQNYRNQKLIPYSLVGGKVYYRMSDVQKMLNKHIKK